MPFDSDKTLVLHTEGLSVVVLLGEQESAAGKEGRQPGRLPCSASLWEPRMRLLFFSLKMRQDVEDDLIAENILTLQGRGRRAGRQGGVTYITLYTVGAGEVWKYELSV